MILLWLVVFVFSLYFLSVLIGFLLGKKEVLTFDWYMKSRRSLTDPFTSKIQRRLNEYKSRSLKHKKWRQFGLLIFLNNFLVAVISRTVYGLLIFFPIYLTVRQGLLHGMLFSNPAFSQPDLKIIFMGILEFGAYFLASAVGLDLSLSLFINLDNPFSTILESLNDGMYAYILIIIFLFMGAFLETSSLKNKLGDLPLDADFDLEELKKQALQKLKGKGIILTLFFQQ